jgi:hypothetical protein
LGAEEGAAQRDRVAHRVDEAGAIAVEERITTCSSLL